MPNVVSLNETFGTREANITLAAGKVTNVFLRVFRIVLDSGGAGADVAAASDNRLPVVGSVHPFASYAICNSIRLRPESNDDKIWTAEIQYSSDVLGDDQEPENPLDAPAKKSWSFAPYQRPFNIDVKGKAVLNKAKDQFDPLPEVEDNRIVLRYSKNVADFDVSQMRQYRRAINSDDFLGWPPNTVRVSGITADDDIQNDVYFWRVTYEFQLRGDDATDDWKVRLLNQGFRQLTGDGSTGTAYEVIQDKNGVALNQPALLDDGGLELTDGDPIFLEFDAYNSLPFSVFGIT